MNRVAPKAFRRLVAVTAPLILVMTVLGVVSASASSAATKQYWPSITFNHQVALKSGEVLQVTGKGFPHSVTVSLDQCNVGLLDAPHGIVDSSTCDLKNTPTTTSSSTGTISTTFTVKKENVNGEAAIYISAHYRGSSFEAWGWASISFTKAAFLTSNPTEPWLNPQTVKVIGLKFPAVASGSTDYVAECNANVLTGDVNACGTPTALTVKSGKAKGSLSVVEGKVGDGTCGTGSADEVCYLGAANVSGSTVTEIALEAIDFYEGQ